MKVQPTLKLLLCLLSVSWGWKQHDHSDDEDCQCELTNRPDKSEKALTARWMAHSLDWGVLSTVSTRLGDGNIPFGNIYSFVDGSCHNSTGAIYMYGTYLDQSLMDTLENPMVSLSLSEASLSSVCANKDRLGACTLGTKYGDPESPVCARLTLTGKLVVLSNEEEADLEEYAFAKEAIVQRHTTMEHWPEDHNWVISKIDIQDIWLIDWFGGATILTPEEYFAATVDLEDNIEAE